MKLDRRYRYVYKPLIFVAAIAPFALLALGAFGLLGRDLGADPVEKLLETCGKTALNLLLITLLVTPLRDLTGNPHVLRVRRMLGLFAFFYAALHFTIYLALDQQLDASDIIEDIAERPYITIGFTALLMLIPLAITSTNRMMRRLGRRWRKLHQLVYVVAVLGVWHYFCQVKADVREPLIYALILSALLGYRLYKRVRPPLTSKSAPARAPERI